MTVSYRFICIHLVRVRGRKLTVKGSIDLPNLEAEFVWFGLFLLSGTGQAGMILQR